MKPCFAIAALAALLFGAMAPSAFAFEAVNNDQFPANIFATRLADPDDIASDMAVQDNAQRFFGENAQISHFGNTTVGVVQGRFIGPSGVSLLPDGR